MTLGGYAIAGLYILYERANFGDFAAKLVADNERRLAASLRPVVPIVYVYVSAANAGAVNSDKHFIVPDGWHGNIFQHESRRGGFFHKRFHPRKFATCHGGRKSAPADGSADIAESGPIRFAHQCRILD